MRVANVTQDIVMELIQEILSERSDLCRCEQCQSDMLVLTLNNVKPQFASTEQGAMFVRTQLLDHQNRVDILVEIGNAIRKVCDSPRH